MKDLRLELRFKNALLWNLIQEHFPCPEDACRARWTGVGTAAGIIGVCYGVLMGLLSLRISPFDRSKKTSEGYYQYRRSAKKVATFFNTLPETIFPQSLYQLRLPKVAIKEVESERILSFQEARAMKLLPVYEMEGGENERLKATLDSVVSSLDSRQQRVIRERFGLEGEEKTLKEIGAEMGVSKERIRQIEARAMCNLRHPQRSKQLEEFA